VEAPAAPKGRGEGEGQARLDGEASKVALTREGWSRWCFGAKSVIVVVLRSPGLDRRLVNGWEGCQLL
jgi:hypothetical protein